MDENLKSIKEDVGVVQADGNKPVLNYTGNTTFTPVSKICNRCCKTKPSYEFYNTKRNKDGKSIYCKECANQMQEDSRKCRKIQQQLDGDSPQVRTIKKILHDDTSPRLSDLQKEVELLRELVRLRKEVGGK